jgi:peptidyl-prolyl cis-trans isomerase C
MIRSSVLTALLACALLQLPASARAAAASNSAPLFPDPLVATGKGFEIKRSQLDDAFINYNAGVVASGGVVPEADRESLRSKLLDHLVINKILLQKATADDKSQVAKYVDGEIAAARTNAPSPEAFDQQIKAMGMTLAQLRDREVEKELCRRILIRETTNGVVVKPADVKKFYDDNPDKFKVPQRVHAAHILISTQDALTGQSLPPDKKKEKLKLANELKARAEKGEDFAALVKQYSDDPGSKNKGGDYTFRRGQMQPAFESAAFSMKVNQISDPVETPFGYHIIKLLDIIPASTIDYPKAESDIHDYLVEQEAEKALPAYLDKLKAGADVKILDQAAAKAAPATNAPAAK